MDIPVRTNQSSDWPLTSVVILSYNSKEYLHKCLNSVLRCNYPNFEIILVDNASSDGSVEYIQSVFCNDNRIKIVFNTKNLGFAEGNNVGAKKAKGKYLVFLNPDTQVEKNWLTELVRVIENYENVGAAQCKLLLMRDPTRFDSAGDFITKYGEGCMRGHREEDRGQYDATNEIFSARGAGFIVRRRLFEEVGGFDPDFFLSYEDLDLCWRIRLRGYKILFVPHSIVYHEGSGIRKKQSLELATFHRTKNKLTMLLKNYTFTNLIKYLPVSITHELFLGMITLPSSKRRLTGVARFKAILWVLGNLGKIWKKRYMNRLLIRDKSNFAIVRHLLPINPFTRALRVRKNKKKKKASKED